MALKIFVHGISGRVGQELAKLIESSKDFVLVGGASRGQPLDNDFGADVVVDFSLSEGLLNLTKWCDEKNLPLVSGTTGVTEEHLKALKKLSAKQPVLWAANMSFGVALLTEALKVFSLAEDYDFQIEETHHRHKKDKPSGTALWLQKHLQETVGHSLPEPLAIRGGGVFGVHRIMAMSDEETLIFEHNALTRAVFAKGALKAAKWIPNQVPGLYEMKDLFLRR